MRKSLPDLIGNEAKMCILLGAAHSAIREDRL